MSKIAIIGANGALGAPTIAAIEGPIFADKIAYPVILFTRNKGDKKDTDKIKYVEASFDEEHLNELYEKFEGIDVIIELFGPNPALYLIIEKILTKVKPKLFIPTQFGCDLENAQSVIPGFLGIKSAHSKNARDLGVKTVDIYTSLFAIEGSFLYEIVGHVGIDPATKTVTYRGNPDANLVTYTRGVDVGNTIISVATSDPATLPNIIRVASGETSQRYIKEDYEKRKGIKLEESTISAEDALKELQEKWAHGFNPADFLFYLQSLVSQGPDKGISFSANENEIVNPGESLWKWSKY